MDILWFSISVWVCAFGIWKKMRTEYESEKIILVLARSLILGILGFVLGKMINFSVLLGISFLVISLYLSTLRYNWELWEWGDEYWYFLLPICVFLSPWYLLSVVGFWAGIYFRRRWRWYKSAKYGLGVVLGGVGFGISSIIYKSGLEFWSVSISQIVGSFVLAFCLIGLYVRSGRNIKIWRKNRLHIHKNS